MTYFIRTAHKGHTRLVPPRVTGINWASPFAEGIEFATISTVHRPDGTPDILDLVTGTAIAMRSGATKTTYEEDVHGDTAGPVFRTRSGGTDGWGHSTSFSGNVIDSNKTLASWVRLASTTSSKYFFVVRGGGDWMGLGISSGKARVSVNNSTQRNQNGTSTVTDGQWHLIAGTSGLSTGQQQIWVDGVQEASRGGHNLDSSSNLSGIELHHLKGGFEINGRSHSHMMWDHRLGPDLMADLYDIRYRWDLFATREVKFFLPSTSAPPSSYTATLASSLAPSSSLAAKVNRSAVLTYDHDTVPSLDAGRGTSATFNHTTLYSGSFEGLSAGLATLTHQTAFSASLGASVSRTGTITRPASVASTVGASTGRTGPLAASVTVGGQFYNLNDTPRTATLAASLTFASGLNAVRHLSGTTMQGDWSVLADLEGSVPNKVALNGSVGLSSGFSGLVSRSGTGIGSNALTGALRGSVARVGTLTKEMAQQLVRLGDPPFTGVIELVENMQLYLDPGLGYSNSYTSDAVKLNNEESVPTMAFMVESGNTVTLQGYVDNTPDGNGAWIDIFSRTTSGWEAVRVPHITRVVVTGTGTTANGTWVAVHNV